MAWVMVLLGAAVAAAGPRTGLLQNEDCTNFFYFQDFPAGKAGQVVDRYVDVLAEAGVTVLLCNTNARRTNYRSDVWQAFWDGYDPQGGDDQPFLASVRPEGRALYRKLVGNMLEVHRQGIDYPARMIERCRHRGIAPWISLRMNDVHENANLEHPFHSPLWRRPELFRQGHPGYYARALDYAHREVREHYKALIVETLARYDVDGLELDFMREPYLFSVGQEQQGRVTLTAWLREIRKLVVDASRRRGHPVKLGVRVPSDPETSLGLGIDAPQWSREGLVDLVVVAPRWRSLEFDLPIARWRELIGRRTTLAGGLDVNYRPTSDSPARLVSPELAAGAAVAVLTGKADALYLFNYFQHGHPQWPVKEYQRILRGMGSLETLLTWPRVHAVTGRDVTVPGRKYVDPLPATGTSLAFPLPLGPSPAADWQVEATIELAASGGNADRPALCVNGVACRLATDQALAGGGRILKYAIPIAALPGRGRDTIGINAVAKTPVIVRRVEVSFRPGSSRSKPDYLSLVRDYADCMLKQGCDRYGKVQSPLFAECLDRNTLRLLSGDSLQRVAGIPFAEWGIRAHDRMLTAANPMHCEGLYLVLYALSQVTGQARYAAEADRSLAFFFEHCQSPTTGLFYWGEHAGWDLERDAPMEGRAANIHEFYRPWELWDRSWRLAPKACQRFARGLWDHQIGDHRTGDYSRHASIDKHGPGTEAPYARHGGFYIATWAHAYQKTNDPVFLTAIETVVDGLERARVAEGMLVGGSKKKGTRTKQDLCLAVSLWDAAGRVPATLAEKLRRISLANDDPGARPVKLASWAAEKPAPASNLWSSGYGASGGEIAGPACTRMLRWHQTHAPAYQKAVLRVADRYLGLPIDRSYPVHPGTVGKVLYVFLAAHELTGDERYLEGADRLAAEAISLFLGDGCPLPKASHVHGHYEAVTGADAMMMALLELWARRQQPAARLGLVYLDR